MNFGKNPPRRTFLQGLCAALPAMSSASFARASESIAIHDYAVQQAVQLKGNRDISLDLLLPNGSGANVAPVVTAFTQATGIAIGMTETPVDDINLRLTLDALGGNSTYDLALPATFGIPDLVEADAIIPISAFARNHEPAGFRDDVLYQTGDTFDNEIYGFQTDGDAYVMFFHKDMLESETEQKRFEDAFGYPLAPPETWEQLDQQIKHFHRPDDDLGGGLLFRTPSYVAWEWWVRFHAKGVWPLSEDLVPQINGPEGVAALEELIAVTEYLCSETSTLGLFGNWERYGKGDVYCNIGWGGSQKYLNGPDSNMRGRMVYAPTPGGRIDGKLLQTPYFNWGWNYVVTSQSQEPELAYLFALFASSSQMSTLSVSQRDGYFDPFRPEHYNAPSIQKAYSTDFLAVHFHSMKNAIPDLYLAQQGQYFSALSEWLSRALHKEVSPQQALNRVADNWSLISVRTDFKKQQKRWQELRNKYPKGVSDLLRDI